MSGAEGGDRLGPARPAAPLALLRFHIRSPHRRRSSKATPRRVAVDVRCRRPILDPISRSRSRSTLSGPRLPTSGPAPTASVNDLRCRAHRRSSLAGALAGLLVAGWLAQSFVGTGSAHVHVSDGVAHRHSHAFVGSHSHAQAEERAPQPLTVRGLPASTIHAAATGSTGPRPEESGETATTGAGPAGAAGAAPRHHDHHHGDRAHAHSHPPASPEHRAAAPSVEAGRGAESGDETSGQAAAPEQSPTASPTASRSAEASSASRPPSQPGPTPAVPAAPKAPADPLSDEVTISLGAAHVAALSLAVDLPRPDQPAARRSRGQASFAPRAADLEAQQARAPPVATAATQRDRRLPA